MAIGVTTRCTPRKSQPKSYPPLGSENQASLEGSLILLAIATKEKGASRVHDCQAIGGSVKKDRPGWEGENVGGRFQHPVIQMCWL